jgi:TolA-binding protein
MAVLFLLLAFLLVVVVGAAGLENTDPSSATLFDRSFSQLSEGQLLVLAAGLGFLVALFLFLAFGASRTRRSRRKELKSRRRDAEGRVDELERENARLKQELTGTREELETVDRDRSDAVAERDRAEATADSVRSDAAAQREPAAPPEPTSVRRERLDDRTGISPADDEHARAADEHARAAEEHAQAAADEEARRR